MASVKTPANNSISGMSESSGPDPSPRNKLNDSGHSSLNKDFSDLSLQQAAAAAAAWQRQQHGNKSPWGGTNAPSGPIGEWGAGSYNNYNGNSSWGYEKKKTNKEWNPQTSYHRESPNEGSKWNGAW